MKAAYCTLGCKVNQYDTDAMRQLMENAGYETVDFSQEADVYIINTCTVTNIADRKSRQMIRRAADVNKNALICVTGCLVQREPEEIMHIEGVDAVLGVNNRGDIVKIVENVIGSRANILAVNDIASEKKYERLEVSHSCRTRAHIKIEDGCNNFCSYCIIPYTRGRVRSRPLDEIAKEATQLAESGAKEVVLTGIHISSYGKDMDGAGLLDAVRCAAAVPGIKRVRLGSIEPTILDNYFCNSAAQIEKLCPHFHVSLQSGSETVLKRMNRHYTPLEYAGFIDNIRMNFDNPAITTDVIAGFNMETYEEHEETLRFVDQIGFAKIHVFPFSERKGTAAVKMGGALPLSERKKRAIELIQHGEVLRQSYISSFVGSKVSVLFEEEKDSYSYGYTDRYVRVRGKACENEIKDVIIKSIQDDVLIS